MFGDKVAPANVLNILRTENVTANLHHDGVSPACFQGDAKLPKFFRVISTNHDRKGKAFVSTIEAFDYPIYGVQWHPEKPQYEFSEPSLVHTVDAYAAMSYTASFLGHEARKNAHTFTDDALRALAILYSHNPSYNPTASSYNNFIFGPAGSHLKC